MITYNFRFFPAAGRRNDSSGAVEYRGTNGYYWSCLAGTVTNGWRLSFTGSNAGLATNTRTIGFTVRCVAKIISHYSCF